MDGELVTIATFNYPVEAELARIHLESEGIEAFIPGNAVSQSVDPAGLYGVRLMVKAEDAERASEILHNNTA